ncbi:MAG: GHKL domain-containing protein [Bdellovibrionaceae bacterium]|nr:GHKL domain-containing protein [Pseudobdellovibrionaceae bacterium]
MSQNLTKRYSVYREILSETKSRSYLGIGINILFSLLLLLTVNTFFGFNFKIFILVYLVLLISLVRWIHLIAFGLFSHKVWHLIFRIMMTVNGTLWSVLIFLTLDMYHRDIKVVTLIHMIFSSLMATASYSLALSKRDFYIFGLQLAFAPLLFFALNREAELNNGFLFATMILFFILIALVRRDYAKQWFNVLNQKNELRLIINSFPGGVSLIKDKKYIYVNELVSQFTGIQPNLFVNEPVGFARAEDAFSSMYLQFEKSNLKSVTQEVFLNVNGSSKLFLLILKRMEEDESIIIAITLDIHDQRQNEMALQSAAKMAALGEMSSSLAHEINNPLAVISAQVTQLSRIIDSVSFPQLEKSKFEVGLQRIYKTVFRISEIIKGLRQIARNDASDPKQLAKIQDILQETISLCETKCRNYGIEIRKNLTDEAAWVSCHPAQISQVILNLLNNSIYAVENIPEKWIEISIKRFQGSFTLKVRDSGAGIPKEVADKIMTPFFTTKPTGKGTGLGLSISKSIIEQHDGEFYYDISEKNTTFVIKLPLSPQPEGQITF